MNLDEVSRLYFERSKKISSETEHLYQYNCRFKFFLQRKLLIDKKANLTTYYSWLQEMDGVYIGDMLCIGEGYDVVARSRNVFMSSLNSYENALGNVENVIVFKVTTGIAMLALIVSFAQFIY